MLNRTNIIEVAATKQHILQTGSPPSELFEMAKDWQFLKGRGEKPELYSETLHKSVPLW